MMALIKFECLLSDAGPQGWRWLYEELFLREFRIGLNYFPNVYKATLIRTFSLSHIVEFGKFSLLSATLENIVIYPWNTLHTGFQTSMVVSAHLERDLCDL